MSHRFITSREVCVMTGKTRLTINKWVKAGVFPAPKSVGTNGFNKVWLSSELDDYFADPEGWADQRSCE